MAPLLSVSPPALTVWMSATCRLGLAAGRRRSAARRAPSPGGEEVGGRLAAGARARWRPRAGPLECASAVSAISLRSSRRCRRRWGGEAGAGFDADLVRVRERRVVARGSRGERGIARAQMPSGETRHNVAVRLAPGGSGPAALLGGLADVDRARGEPSPGRASRTLSQVVLALAQDAAREDQRISLSSVGWPATRW